jgi:uncharacterized membrane protein HdeD (DUF308 family)
MMDIPTTLPGGPLGTVTGLLLIILGIMALVFPALVFSLIVVFFAIYAAIISLELIRSGLADPDGTNIRRTVQILAGIAGIIIGFLILVLPYFVSVAAKDLFGFWALLTGAAGILSVFAGTGGLERALSALSGTILVIVGILLLFAPGIIADFLLVVILGIFAIIIGIFSIWFARADTGPEQPINHTIYK